MSIELTTNQTVPKKVEVQATASRIHQLLMDIDGKSIKIMLQYSEQAGEEFTPVSQRVLEVSGATYWTAIQAPSNGSNTVAENFVGVLIQFIADVEDGTIPLSDEVKWV